MNETVTKQQGLSTGDIEPPCVDCTFFKWDTAKHRCANWEKRVCLMHVLQVYTFLFSENVTGTYH